MKYVNACMKGPQNGFIEWRENKTVKISSITDAWLEFLKARETKTNPRVVKVKIKMKIVKKL